jgi:uridylate kinase
MRYLNLTCTKESSSSSPAKPSPQAGFGIDAIFIHKVAEEIAAIHALGCEIAIVVGGGNFFRGVAQQAIDMDRVAADHMGMLSTVINAIALQDAIEKRGLFCRVMSAIEMHQVAEPYIRRRAMRHLEKGRIVIFAAGTGNPYFSTDTAASLRAMEIKADILLKATSVDGIYTADPKRDPNATKLRDQISYDRHPAPQPPVMDTTAVSLCRDNNMPMMVFSMREQGNIVRVVAGRTPRLPRHGIPPWRQLEILGDSLKMAPLCKWVQHVKIQIGNTLITLTIPSLVGADASRQIGNYCCFLGKDYPKVVIGALPPLDSRLTRDAMHGTNAWWQICRSRSRTSFPVFTPSCHRGERAP